MHRIIHLPLSCWADVLAGEEEEGEGEGEGEHPSDDDAATYAAHQVRPAARDWFRVSGFGFRVSGFGFRVSG